MDCEVDWVNTLRRASFRGVPFWVETDDISYGRRINTWEFPNRDRPYQEDMGEKAIDFSVTAYIAGDNVLSTKAALVSACRRRGSGTLVLPTEGSIRVVCFECTRTHKKDQLGYLAFSLHFGEAGSGFGTFSMGLAVANLGGSVQALVGALARDFVGRFSSNASSFVLPVATSTVRHWMTNVDAVRMSTRMKSSENTALLSRLSRAYRGAERLAYDGRSENRLSASSANIVPADLGASGAPKGTLVFEMAEIAAAIRFGAQAPSEAVAALTQLASYEAPAVDTSTGSLTAKQEAANVEMVASIGRRVALAELAMAAVEADYADRRSAIRVRAELAELFERELASAKGEAFQLLDRVRGAAVDAISRKVADIAPTITVEANAPLPSLLWGMRLYGDAGRADELTARNRVRHPAFMPVSFEALAPGDSTDEPKRLFA